MFYVEIINCIYLLENYFLYKILEDIVNIIFSISFFILTVLYATNISNIGV